MAITVTFHRPFDKRTPINVGVVDAIEQRVTDAGRESEDQIAQLRNQVRQLALICGVLAEAALDKNHDRSLLAAELLPYGYSITFND